MTGLAPGAYRVRFYDVPGYVGEWYDNQSDDNSATEVLVIAERTADCIDAVLTQTGSISGRVTGTGGLALQGVTVYAEGTAWGGWAQTDALGSYSVTGLPAGAYKLQFSGASGYLDQWYDNKPDYESAAEVQVSAGQNHRRYQRKACRGGEDLRNRDRCWRDGAEIC